MAERLGYLFVLVFVSTLFLYKSLLSEFSIIYLLIRKHWRGVSDVFAPVRARNGVLRFLYSRISLAGSGLQSVMRQVRKFPISRHGEEADFSPEEARFEMTG